MCIYSRLFHATDESTVEEIVKGNFNRSFAGKNSTSYGQGSYFARDASYSARVRKGGENYSVPNEEGFKFVILCRVLVGDFCRGYETFKVPPDMPDGTRRYDTTVDNTEDPTVFVTYNDAQVYPEYIVKFQDTSPESVEHGEMTKLNAEARARCQSGAAQGKRTNASQPSPTKAERERKRAAAEAAAVEKAARRIAQEQSAAQGVDPPADTSPVELVLTPSATVAEGVEPHAAESAGRRRCRGGRVMPAGLSTVAAISAPSAPLRAAAAERVVVRGP